MFFSSFSLFFPFSSSRVLLYFGNLYDALVCGLLSYSRIVCLHVAQYVLATVGNLLSRDGKSSRRMGTLRIRKFICLVFGLYCGVFSYVCFFVYFLQLSSDGNTTTSILTFVPGKDDAGKRLSCKAENPHVNQDILDTGWNLQINCK